MDEVFGHAGATGGSGCRRGTRESAAITAPDGGWGYVVCIGVGLIFMLGFGSSSAFGILFHEFFLEQERGDGVGRGNVTAGGGGGAGLAYVIGVYNGSLSIAGFLAGLALKRYTFRQVGLLGALLFVIGDLLTIFVTKTYHLVLTFGLIRGAGFGALVPVGFTAFNSYFQRRRTAMMSANQTMSSAASISFPLLVTWLLQRYGFRGALALLAALDLHLVAAALVMHPVDWHAPAPPPPPPLHCHIEGANLKSNTVESGKPSVVSTGGARACVPAATPRRRGDHDAGNTASVNKLDDKTGLIARSIWSKIGEHVDVELLRRPRFLSTLLGLGLAFVSDVTYLALEPMLLFHYGYDNVEVAYCVMLGAACDLAARCLLAVYTSFYSVNSRLMFFVGVCVTVFMRIALVSGSAYWYVCTVTALGGFVRCAVQVLFPLVLADAAPPDRFPAALALHILFSGALMLLADPLIGVLYEWTGSYVHCFLAMSFCCLACVVLWTTEYFYYRGRNK